MTVIEPPPEGRLLHLARNGTPPRGLSMRAAAKLAGVSETHWRNVESGKESKAGMQIPVRAAADTLARMARVVGLTPERLTQAGRADAAEILDEIIRREHEPASRREHQEPAAPPDIVRDNWDDPVVQAVWTRKRIAPKAREGMIAWYVAERDAAESQPALRDQPCDDDGGAISLHAAS